MKPYIFFVVMLFLNGPAVQAEKPSKGKEVYHAMLVQDGEKLKTLLSSGGDANHKENGRPVLAWAAQNGNVEIVNVLLKAGANPNIADEGIGHTPLMRAIETQQLETVKALLAAKANPNAVAADGRSCLVMAIESRKPEIVQLLLDAHVDLKAVSKDGDSPALAAAQDGTSEGIAMIRMIGKAGANLNVSNLVYTPLVYAVEQGNKELVQALLESGADPNAKTKMNQTPIEKSLDNPEILVMLLKAKADPNTPMNSDNNLLIEAIRNRQLDAAKLLIEAGADLNKTDYAGDNALKVAERASHTEIVEAIKKKTGGASLSEKDLRSIKCDIGDAAKKQMEIHGLLQAEVNAGKRNSDIFRTFNEDTKDYGTLLTSDPSEACRLFERLRVKYGLVS